MNDQLPDAVHTVARLRDECEALLQEAEAIEAKLNETPEARALSAARAALRAKDLELRYAKTEARELAIKAYRETGSKKPTAGVRIALYENVLYDRDEALAWCKVHVPALVCEALNEQAFRKTALHLPGAPIEVTADPRARLDTDLSALLSDG